MLCLRKNNQDILNVQSINDLIQIFNERKISFLITKQIKDSVNTLKRNRINKFLQNELEIFKQRVP